MVGKIFINYRRGDDPGFTGRLFDQLDNAFETGQLFMDVDSIDPGLDFVDVLSEQVARCDVFLSVIGQEWLDARDERGERRLDSPNDFVRIEIESALEQGKRVIPVLVNDAKLPSADDLPESLKPLVRRNAVRLTHDRFRADSAGLIGALKSALEEAEQTRLAEKEERRRAEEEREKEAARRAEELSQQKQEHERLNAISGLSPEDIAKATELVNWRHIEDSDRADDFRDHLARFSDGACSSVARAKLESIVWNELPLGAKADVLEAFITEFPEGQYVTEAQNRLAQWKKEEEEAAKQELREQRLAAAWEETKNANTAAAFEAFLLDWPSSVYAADARRLLKERRRDERKASGGNASVWSDRAALPLALAVALIGGLMVFAMTRPDRQSDTYDLPSSSSSPSSSISDAESVHDFPPVPDDAANPQFVPQVGHGSSVRGLAISPDGRWLATSGHDTIKVWDAKERHLVRTIKTAGTYARDLAFSPDGRMIASSGGKTVDLWDLATGQRIRTFKGHRESVLSIAFSPDGKLLASGSIDESAKIWHVATGGELTSFDNQSRFVYSVAFSPDGRQFAAGSGELKIWDASNGVPLRELKGHDYGVESFAYSPDGSLIATGDAKGPVRIWDANSGKLVRVLPGHKYAVNRLSFSPDGRTLATTGSDTIKLWNVADGKLLNTVADGEERVYGLAYFPDGQSFATGNEVGNVHIRDATDGGSIHTFKTSGLGVRSISFAPDGRHIVSAGRDRRVRVWDVRRGKLVHDMEGHGNPVNAVAYSPNGQLIASGSGDSMMRGSNVIDVDDSSVKLWNAQSGELVRKLEGHVGGVLSLAFSSDGKMLASGGQQETVILWDVETGRKLHTLTPEGVPYRSLIQRVWFSVDGKTIYGANFIKETYAWDVATGRFKEKLQFRDKDEHPVISPDGRIRAHRNENEVDLLDAKSGRLLATLAVLPDGQWVSYTPNGDYVSSTGARKYFSIASGMNSYSVSSVYMDRHQRRNSLNILGEE